MTNFWWVNQNKTYDQERSAGILWAPKYAKGGGTRGHWESMLDVRTGDTVLHYAGSTVRAISTVTIPAVDSRRPYDLPADLWDQDGRLVRATYRQTRSPITRFEIPDAWKVALRGSGPFQRNLEVKQGYLFPLSRRFGEDFLARFGSRFPAPAPTVPIVPAEARTGATDLLRRLIGVPLKTITGSPNVILGVSEGTATVATARSTTGQPVPVAEVQAALDQLTSTGSVTVSPETVGYRSAFVGAVLLTLPGATVAGSPPVITLRATPPSPPHGAEEGAGGHSAEVTFEGDLSLERSGLARGEQAALRRTLFGAATHAHCAICGEHYPVRFLWSAHIKKRSVCSDTERRDLQHVAMAACVFGCDALFETGYLTVDATGRVLVATDDPALGSALHRRLEDLAGRGCLAFTARSQQYFAWHRENIFRGPSQ